jgi:hypothetical protein
MHPIPPNEQVKISLELAPILDRRRTSGQGRKRTQELGKRIRGRRGHGSQLTPDPASSELPDQAFLAARAGTFSGFLPIFSMYFCWPIWSTFERVQ